MDTRAGSYARRLQTRAGLVNLKVPRLRKATLETVIIERYKRRESSIEEALIQMYLAGVSVRRIEDITQALWGTRVNPGKEFTKRFNHKGKLKACGLFKRMIHAYFMAISINFGRVWR